jgi:hypothetical protein
VLATYYLDGAAIGVVGVNAPHAFTVAARALQASVVMTPRVLRPVQHVPAAPPPPPRFGMAV